MNEAQARKILKGSIRDDNLLNSVGQGLDYCSWDPHNDSVCLDGNFTIEELEAIVWWIKNKKILFI